MPTPMAVKPAFGERQANFGIEIAVLRGGQPRDDQDATDHQAADAVHQQLTAGKYVDNHTVASRCSPAARLALPFDALTRKCIPRR